MFLLVKTEQASAGAHAILDQLPNIDNIELAALRDVSFYSEIGGCCCSYGRLSILYGTSLSSEVAFNLFIQKLQASGWIVEGKEYETSRGFVRGYHEYLNISYGGTPGVDWDWGQHPDYLAAATNYSNILKVRIDYMLPTRKVCWGR